MKYLIVALITIIASSAFAQTEISGSVSGVWTADDSPYIVVDSTWVPEGDTLTIEAGVTVKFGDSTGIWIYGLIDAAGEEEDSVRFEALYDSTTWQGIILYGSRRLHEFDYCVITGAPDGISLIEDHIRLYVGHSVIKGEYKAIGSRRWSNENSITVEHTVLLGQYNFTDLDFTTINISNSIVYKNIVLGGIRIIARECVFYDNIFAVYSDFYNCRFLISGTERNTPEVQLNGDMENCVSEVFISTFALPCRIINLETIGSVNSDTEIFIDSSKIGGHLNHWADSDITLRNTIVEGGLDIRANGSNADISKCVAYGRIYLSADGSITVDSCEFLTLYPDNINGGSLYIPEAGSVSLKRSLLTIPLNLSGCVSILFENNTFCFYKFYRNRAIESSGYQSFEIRNNIFYAIYDGLTLFRDHSYDRSPTFQYNVLHGFMEYFWDERSIFEIDSTNLEADPLFVFAGSSDFHLLEDSPCINAGDPNSPRDPDGTRADIGAYYFHHELSYLMSGKPIPTEFSILDLFPNPFNSSFKVIFQLPAAAHVSIQVYDVNGRIVKDIPKKAYSYGEHAWDVDGSDLTSGNYWVKLKTRKEEVTKQVVLVR